MRNDGLSPDDPDTLDKFNKSKSIPMALRSPEQRAPDLGDALNWGGCATMPTMLLVNSASLIRCCLPKKRGQSPDDRARELEGALDWMRSNGVSPELKHFLITKRGQLSLALLILARLIRQTKMRKTTMTRS
jgi:hypothetical protein